MASLTSFLLFFFFFLSFFFFCLQPLPSVGLPLCRNSESPVTPKEPLGFCGNAVYNVSSCCNSTMDANLQDTFRSFNVSNNTCATFLKQILCAQCDPYAASLFSEKSTTSSLQPIPLLCNSSSTAYCSMLWDACGNVSILNSPFSTNQANGTTTTTTTLVSLWQSSNKFCSSLGVPEASGSICYSGKPFVPINGSNRPIPEGICFDKVSDGVFLNLVPYPDASSNRFFLSNQVGKIWLGELNCGVINYNESAPFLDLSDKVASSNEFGLLGFALHPNFKENGRLFVSYNCDRTLFPDCAGQCACNADAGCKPSDLGSEAGQLPCQYSSIIAEYSANTSSGSSLQALVVNSTEVRKIFKMGLPYLTHHGGQILFGPTDGHLYFMMGDGGSSGDPFNFAQNKKSLLGKIMRLDVDNIPSDSVLASLDRWGSYAIPDDNPFVSDNTSRPEIWAYGFRNPWRCAFDDLDPTYFYCADVGQEVYEEVDLITKGGNYGWRVYEGPSLYTPLKSPGGNTSLSSIQPISPILWYDHHTVNPTQGTASITGGFVSRSTEDACLYGRYFYADLYGTHQWAAIEYPLGSGKYNTSLLNFGCSSKSPMNCTYDSTGMVPSFLYVFSFAEDIKKNVYLLSQNGVYRVVDPSNCNFACTEKLPSSVIPLNSSSCSIATTNATSPTSQISSEPKRVIRSLVSLLFSMFIALLFC